MRANTALVVLLLLSGLHGYGSSSLDAGFCCVPCAGTRVTATAMAQSMRQLWRSHGTQGRDQTCCMPQVGAEGGQDEPHWALGCSGEEVELPQFPRALGWNSARIVPQFRCGLGHKVRLILVGQLMELFRLKLANTLPLVSRFFFSGSYKTNKSGWGWKESCLQLQP